MPSPKEQRHRVYIYLEEIGCVITERQHTVLSDILQDYVKTQTEVLLNELKQLKRTEEEKNAARKLANKKKRDKYIARKQARDIQK